MNVLPLDGSLVPESSTSGSGQLALVLNQRAARRFDRA